MNIKIIFVALIVALSSAAFGASSTLNNLPAASSPLDGTELYYTVQGGTDRKATGNQLRAAASFTRSQITSKILGPGTFAVNGFSVAGDLGTGAIYTSIGATLAGPMAITDAGGTIFNLVVNGSTNVGYWGAKGDGTADDGSAIVAANIYLGSVGGGRLEFPCGHFVSTGFNPIIVFNNMEYFGHGSCSFIDFSNVIFATPFVNGNQFNQQTIAALSYFSASDITGADKSVTTTIHANAGNFSIGDMIYIRSNSSSAGVGTELPYYNIITQVTSSNAATGVIGLQDAIPHSWTGIKVAKVTAYFSVDYDIHDLRLRSDYSIGAQSFALAGSYRASIYNTISEGAAILSMNGFVNSSYRDNIATYNYSSTHTYPIMIELKVGSSNSRIENNEFFSHSVDGTAPAGNVGYQNMGEYSRHIFEHGNRLYSPELNLLYAFNISDNEEGNIDTEYVRANTITGSAISYGFSSASGGALQSLSTQIHNIVFDVNSIAAAMVLLSGNVAIQNLNVSNVNVTGTAPYVLFFAQDASNSSFDHLSANGVINDGGVPHTYSNVNVSNSYYTQVIMSTTSGIQFSSNVETTNAGIGVNNIVFDKTTIASTSWMHTLGATDIRLNAGLGGSLWFGSNNNSALAAFDTAGTFFTYGDKFLIGTGTAIPAGGATDKGYQFSSAARFGVFYGSGAPTLTAFRGSLYVRSDGKPYYNTDGAVGWDQLAPITSPSFITPNLGVASATSLTSSNAIWAGTQFLNTSAVPSIAACGTNPSVITGSNNQGGQFIFGSGSVTSCAVSFANAFPNFAWCVLGAANTTAANVLSVTNISASPITGMNIASSANSGGAKFNYNCQGS